jgi:hypothetical protein
MFRRILIPVLVVLPVLAGCAESPDSHWTHGAITGGTDSGPEDDGVVWMLSPRNACSATLVAPNLLIATAHCVALGGAITGFSCNADGELDNGGSGAGEIGENYAPEQLAVRTGALPSTEVAAYGRQVLSSGTTAVCRNDIAFIVLDRALEGLPLLPVRLDAPIQSGEPITVIGYGLTGMNDVEIKRRRRSGLTVLGVDTPPRTFITGGGPCAGDSGGPALATETGAVLGVFSVLHDTCGSEISASVYTQLAPFRELAMQAFQSAGAEPWLEGRSEPGLGGPDATGDAGASSVSGCSLPVSSKRTRRPDGLLALFGVMGLLVGGRRRTKMAETAG